MFKDIHLHWIHPPLSCLYYLYEYKEKYKKKQKNLSTNSKLQTTSYMKIRGAVKITFKRLTYWLKPVSIPNSLIRNTFYEDIQVLIYTKFGSDFRCFHWRKVPLPTFLHITNQTIQKIYFTLLTSRFRRENHEIFFNWMWNRGWKTTKYTVIKVCQIFVFDDATHAKMKPFVASIH